MSELRGRVAKALAEELVRQGRADNSDDGSPDLVLARLAIDAVLEASDETVRVMAAAIVRHGHVDEFGYPNISLKAAMGYARAALGELKTHVFVGEELSRLGILG